jgi:hypothetical protein
MIYVQATNHGLGFLTHDETLDLKAAEVEPGIWRVADSASSQAWIQRVGGLIIDGYQPPEQTPTTSGGNFA